MNIEFYSDLINAQFSCHERQQRKLADAETTDLLSDRVLGSHTLDAVRDSIGEDPVSVAVVDLAKALAGDGQVDAGGGHGHRDLWHISRAKYITH